ncbi:MAG: division/cell wall cluster transcriptional repressor MraZ [Spirochaetes bacterium]|nr:division/cell wall cluster transcriptional repressor MraZ [Spirochaetota bacterium]
MFLGKFNPTIDEKNRLAIPAKFRKTGKTGNELNSLIILPGFDGCIMGFAEPEWKKFVSERIETLSQSDPENRRKTRFLYSNAVECELDKQGRIILPPELKVFAGIEKEAVVIGVYDRIEIWSPVRYNEYAGNDDSAAVYLEGNLGF